MLPLTHRNAFTLIELSVVLVIIGLIAGGVLVGRDLIESSKVAAQISQLAKYSTALNTFKSKYDDLPGDMLATKAKSLGFTYNAATNSWNANGNGIFDSTITTSAPLYIATDEEAYFWPDLSKSGLIQEQLYCPSYNTCPWYAGSVYTGTVATYPATVSLYFPATKLNPSYGMLPITLFSMGGNWWYLGIMSYNYSLGQATTTAPSLTPLQAQKLDAKMDDGRPGGGGVRMLKNYGGADVNGVWYSGLNIINDDNIAQGYYTPANCVNTGGGSYNVANTAVACSAYVKIQ